MFSPKVEAELETVLPAADRGPYNAPPVQRTWNHIRANAQQIALQEYQWWLEGKRIENEPGPAVPNKLNEYWSAVSKTTFPWDVAWSAAFISWVVRKAGAGTGFWYAAAHRTYVHWAIRNGAVDPAHPVQASPVTAVRPRVGDLVCNWRESMAITFDELRNLAEPPPGHKMHCEIVVGVEPDRIRVIGGNKKPAAGVACPPGQDGCTVNLSDVGLTNGLLTPLKGSTRGWIAVVRMGP